MNLDQLRHYQSKLAYEMDSWDLHVALSNGEPLVVVDGRSEAAFTQEHIPGAINLPHRGNFAPSALRLWTSQKPISAIAMALAATLQPRRR